MWSLFQASLKLYWCMLARHRLSSREPYVIDERTWSLARCLRPTHHFQSSSIFVKKKLALRRELQTWSRVRFPSRCSTSRRPKSQDFCTSDVSWHCHFRTELCAKIFFDKQEGQCQITWEEGRYRPGVHLFDKHRQFFKSVIVLIIVSGIGSACCNTSVWVDGIRGWLEDGSPPS